MAYRHLNSFPYGVGGRLARLVAIRRKEPGHRSKKTVGARACEVAGHLMERQDLCPPRFLVREFPNGGGDREDDEAGNPPALSYGSCGAVRNERISVLECRGSGRVPS